MSKPVLFVHPERQTLNEANELCGDEIIQAFTPEQAQLLLQQLNPSWIITTRETLGWPLDCIDRKLLDYDMLTGLLTRTAFLNRLYQRATQIPTLILIFSLDRFSMINDSLGLEMGDALLKAIGERLNRITRQQDEVAHLGCDQFAIMVAQCAPGQCDPQQVAQRFFKQLSEPFKVNGRTLHLSISMGATYSISFDNPEALFLAASGARAEAKQYGGGQLVFHDQSQQSKDNQHQLTLENHLRYALKKGEIEIWYQPQVDAHTRQHTGAEALLRWNHPRLGMISPQEFIPIAERTGLIESLSLFALETVLSHIHQLSQYGLKVNFGINLSPQQFHYDQLVDEIAQRLQAAKIDPHTLEIEIIESQVMHRVEEALPIMHRLKKLGLKLALDDFGTGYSSLAWLSRFPVDTLKIDQSFVKQLPDPTAEKIIRALVALAQTLNLTVIAEGIENEAQADFLQQAGVDILQGYLFGSPISAQAFLQTYLKPSG